MKIAVTGALGFIGKHVVNHLLSQGHLPTILTRRPAARPTEFRSINLACFDLADPPDDAYEQLGSPDVMVHLAWSGLPNYSSLHHFEEELPNQFRFLKLLVSSGLKHLVVSGTCFEYGMKSGCLSESDQPDPVNAYALAKDALRRELQCLQKVTSFQLTWTRLFYLHGKGQPANSILPQLEAAIERGDEFFNMSPGDQLRDYLPVEEVARILAVLALGPSVDGVLNVCSGRPVSVRRLVEEWIKQRNAAIKPNLGYYPYSEHEPLAFWGSRDRLDRHLSRL